MIAIKTYQDLIAVGEDEKKRMEFVQSVIADHKGSSLYQNALIAEDYYAGLNRTIANYQKIIRDAYGRAVPDIWSPNHKIACHYYRYLVTQLAMFLLGNGVSFGKTKNSWFKRLFKGAPKYSDTTKEKLGTKFDNACVTILINALNHTVAYGLVGEGSLTPFSVLEFAAMPDEETSAIRAGVRFWQLNAEKPLRATLYEEDGYTDYIKRKGEDMEVLNEKRPYVQIVQHSDALGDVIVDGRNYPTFPIVPLYNYGQRSELDGNREAHDALDLMLSGLINNVDAGEIIYWLVKNSGGMDQPSMNQLLQTLKTAHMAQVDTDEEITAHSPQVQFAASKEAIDQLRRQVFDNHMGLDVRNIASGAATATQIKAAYEPMNTKADLLEFCVTDFILGVLAVLGIDDVPTYTRSYIVNQQESIGSIIAAGDNLPQSYKTRKILEILGDIDKVEEVLAEMDAAESGRFTTGNENAEPGGTEPEGAGE